MPGLDLEWEYGVTAVLVAAFLALRLPALNDHVYPQYGARVAISHVIIAQEFIDHGLQIFTYQTYGESTAGAHLFAITGSPLVALFGPSGLRVWGLLLTGIATVLIGVCATRWFGRRCGLIACTVMVFSPMVTYFGTAVYPEAFHLTATVAAVAAYGRATRHDHRILYTVLAGVCVVAATADHLWGAYILAPLGVLVVQRRDWLDGAAFAAAARIGVLIVQIAQAELNDGRSVIEAYSVLYHPDYLWNPTFYTDLTVNIIGFAFSPLLGVALVGAAIWTATKPGSLRVVGIWFLAGLAIPLAFPRGADAHFYYFWGALAPGAILTGVAVVAGSEWVSEQSWGLCGVTELHYVLVTSIGVIALLLVSSFVVGPAGLGVPPQDRASQITEGETVRDTMVYANADDEDVIIVTDLPVYSVESGESAMVHAYLMYSDLAFGGPDSPMAAPTVDQAEEQGARVIVNLQDSFVETKQPGRFPRILVCDNDGCVKFSDVPTNTTLLTSRQRMNLPC